MPSDYSTRKTRPTGNIGVSRAYAYEIKRIDSDFPSNG